MNIEIYEESSLTEPVVREIAELAHQCFPNSEKSVEDRVQGMLEELERGGKPVDTGRRFLIRSEAELIAHARTFVRHVFAGDQEIPVLALATVCTKPSHRGKGLGVAVTREAFEQVGQPGWPTLSLFQTPVPDFYEKLNSRVVKNRFVNRLNAEDPEANPWRDDTVMIYPAESPWPEGVIDLNGPDY